MEVPLVDLSVQHRAVQEDVWKRFDRLTRDTSFVLGEEVAEFESAFATFTATAYCVGVANGTDALELALRALGVGPGDEVVVPANSFFASAGAIARAGARPVFVDVDDRYLLMDPDAVEGALSPATRVVMPVHLFGQCAPVEAIRERVSGRGIEILEDAAQAQGAARNGRAIGAWGRAAATSFYPGKNLGAYGDAGAVLTDDAEIADRIRRLRDHGSAEKYRHDTIGFNSRLDSMQAAVLNAKLAFLPGWNDQRRAAAETYGRLLAAVDGVRVPEVMEGNEHVWHLYVVRIPGRDEVLRRMRERGVGVQIHYPIPIHLQRAFKGLGYEKGDLPVAEAAADEILSLPLYPGITPEQQEYVVTALRDALAA